LEANEPSMENTQHTVQETEQRCGSPPFILIMYIKAKFAKHKTESEVSVYV